MADERQKVVCSVSIEIDALREAILANDLPGIERHTAAIHSLLADFKTLLLSNRASNVSCELIALHAKAGGVRSLVQKLGRTARALLNVHRTFCASDASTPELR